MSSESEIKESIKHLELQLMQKREELDNLQRNPLRVNPNPQYKELKPI